MKAQLFFSVKMLAIATLVTTMVSCGGGSKSEPLSIGGNEITIKNGEVTSVTNGGSPVSYSMEEGFLVLKRDTMPEWRSVKVTPKEVIDLATGKVIVPFSDLNGYFKVWKEYDIIICGGVGKREVAEHLKNANNTSKGNMSDEFSRIYRISTGEKVFDKNFKSLMLDKETGTIHVMMGTAKSDMIINQTTWEVETVARVSKKK